MDFKRSANTNNDFHAPKCLCFACDDSGIVQNGDGLLSSLVRGYDTNDEGVLIKGSDLALICWCSAAYPVMEDGRIIQYGFREDSGSIRTVENRGKQVAVGVSCPKDVTTQLHRVRRAAWESTVRIMQQKRDAARRGEPVQPTPAMVAAREAIDTTGWPQSRAMAPVGSVLVSVFNRIENNSTRPQAGPHPKDFDPGPGPDLHPGSSPLPPPQARLDPPLGHRDPLPQNDAFPTSSDSELPF